MKLFKLALVGCTAAMLGACAKDAAKAEADQEISTSENMQTARTSADSSQEDEELQEKLSRLSLSLKSLADTMGKNAEKTGASMSKDLAGIQSELGKVGEMIRKGSEDSQVRGRQVLGKVVDEMDHLVKRMQETLDEE